MSTQFHAQSPNHENAITDEQVQSGVKKTLTEEQQEQHHSQDSAVGMALPPSGDEESGSKKTSRKRMVHNAIERQRKVKINNHIHNLAKLLPNEDGKRWSKNETLEKAVEYIRHIKEDHEKMILGKLDEVQAGEYKRMKRRIEELELQNSTYVKLLEIAGIPPNSDPNAAWLQSKSANQINPETIVMGDNGEIMLMDNNDKCKIVKSKKKNGKVEDNSQAKAEVSLKEQTSVNMSTSSSSEDTPCSVAGGTWNLMAGLSPSQQVLHQNGMIIVSPSSLVSGPKTTASQGMAATTTVLSNHTLCSSNVQKSNACISMANTRVCHQPSNIVTTALAQLAELTAISNGASIPAMQESLITNAASNVTAVTRSLSGAPIMSTSQFSSGIQQQPNIVPQLPMLNFGGTMNVMQGSMQPMITINEQGIPVLQMVAGPPQMTNGQVIVNGPSTQNLVLMGNTAGSTVPHTMNSNVNTGPTLNHQASMHIATSARVPTSCMQFDCQALQTQNLIQTDTGIFQQAVCGNQLMGQTAQYLSAGLTGTMQQMPTTNVPNSQMRIMTQSVGNSQNANVMLGASMQGSQNGNTVLTVNSNSSTSNLPSALMLPNGQIIPVVREPSLLYPNSAPVGGSVLMTTPASNVSQTLMSTSQMCQSHTSLSNTLATTNRRHVAVSGEMTVDNSSASLLHLSQVRMHDGCSPHLLSNPLPTSVAGGHINGNARTVIQSFTTVPPRTGSNSSMCSLGERPMSASLSAPGTPTDTTSLQGKKQDVGNNTSGLTATSSGATGSKKPPVSRRTQRVIKPKPVSSKVPANPSKKGTSKSASPRTLPSAKEANASAASSKSVSSSGTMSTSPLYLTTTSPPAKKNTPATQVSTTTASLLPSKGTTASASLAKSTTQNNQTNSSPSTPMTDILAQATESIFANSISDISSSPNPNYFGNSSSNSNSSQVDFLQSVMNDANSIAKLPPAQSDITVSLMADSSDRNKSPATLAITADEGVMMDITNDGQRNKEQQQGVDILSDLVGEVYSAATANQSSPVHNSADLMSPCVTSATGSVPFDTSFNTGKDSVSGVGVSSPAPNSVTCTKSATESSSSQLAASSDVEDNLTMLSNGSSPMISNETTMHANLELSVNENLLAGEKTKRSCEAETPMAKRSRPNDLSSDNHVALAEPAKEEAVPMTSVAANANNNMADVMGSPQQSDSSSCTIAVTSSVNFVSVSQLASSASSAVSATSSSCAVTFTSTMAPSITSFSIDAAISNENSPLCSISPLLSSPNKSSDLAFTLGSAISDLPRSNESQFSAGGTSNVGGSNIAGLNSDMNTIATTNAPFTALSSSFGSTTSLSSSSASTFCIPDLTNLNSNSMSNAQGNFRSLPYSAGSVNAQRTHFNGMSGMPPHGVAEPPSPSNAVVSEAKSHKLHSLHYSHRQGVIRPQQPPGAPHNQQPQISSHHTPNLSNLSPIHHHSLPGNNLQFSPSHIPVQIAPFCQPYSSPLSHQAPRAPHSHMNITHGDPSKAKSNTQRRPSINGSEGVQQNGIMSPPTMNHAQLNRPHSLHQIGSNQEAMITGLGPIHCQTQNYQSIQRIHSLNRHSPQGGNSAPSPKIVDMQGHSPVNIRGAASNSSTSSPKPHLPMPQGQLLRSHPVPSPGRNPLPTPPVSSPATFVPRRSPNVSAGDPPMITSYSADNVHMQNVFRDLNFPPGQKQLTHPPIISSSATINPTTRAAISYSAESLIQAQPSHRPNCAREGHAASGRQPVHAANMHDGGGGVSAAGSNSGPNPLPFMQGGNARPSNADDIHQVGFPYFATFQQASAEQISAQAAGMPPPSHPGNALKHTHTQNHSNMNKLCPMRGTSDATPQAIQSQPNFSFSLVQHSPTSGSIGAEIQQQASQPHQPQQGTGQDGISAAMRHNNYLSMENYPSHVPPPGSMTMPGLQGSVHKDMQMPRPPMPFTCIPPFHSNQTPTGQVSNVRQASNNTFLPQHGSNAMNSAPSFPEAYSVHGNANNSLRPDNASSAPLPVGGSGGNANANHPASSNVQGSEKGGSTTYKSRTGSGNKQDGSSTSKSKSKQPSQHSRKKHQQYSVEEVNLSNSIFETGRSMTPYFTIPNLSPPRNEVPTYIPNPNPLFNASQRGLAPNSGQQPKSAELGAPYSSLFPPRTQNGLNLNFQAPSFSMNHLHSNGGMPNQITSHSGGVNVTSHVPNFNLSNIFPDINNSNEGISISPIKFHHGNHILPPPQAGMDHNLQHHQSGTLYHKRPHPPPVIHNGMTINSLLGHNPHGFDGRSQVPMGINNAMTPPFHSHSHTPSFSNVIPTLNFSMHDH